MTPIIDEAVQYLTFQMAGEEYAVAIMRVREIIQLDRVTRVPSAPRWIRGVVNLRGGVVPVADLALKFGMEASEITKWSCLVIVEVEQRGEPVVMGVLADSVRQVMDLTPEDVEPAPSFGTRIDGEFLLGMARQGNRFALLLDIDRVLSDEETAGVTQSHREDDEED